MNPFVAGSLFVTTLLVTLAVVYRLLGDYLYLVVTGTRHSRIERMFYRVVGVDPEREQTWAHYARSVLALSAVSVLVLFGLLRLQGENGVLSNGLSALPADLAFNVAASFVANANWQSYAGESTMGHLIQMLGLGVQHFISPAVAIAVAVVLMRGFARHRTDLLGNFWVDLTRIIGRVLLPVAVVVAIVMVFAGVVQNFSAGTAVTTLAGTPQLITGGPVASWESIKLFGTNGGGFYNANSAHPFENPAGWTHWLQLVLLLSIPASLIRVFGRMVGQNRQGYAILAVFAILLFISAVLTNSFELSPQGTVPEAVGASTEGKETRYGIWQSALFASLNTVGYGGVTISSHDSYTALGGGVLLMNILVGGLGIGAVGTGIYAYVVFAITTAKLASLMVGRTPEFLEKKIGAREIKLVVLYTLTTPVLVLTGTALAFTTGNHTTALNAGAHGLTEVFYAVASAATANGSAFAGITVNTPWWNTVLGVVILLGRFVPIIVVLALAGSLARERHVAASVGTIPTHRPQFIGMVATVTVLFSGLAFLPALALGPLAEGL